MYIIDTVKVVLKDGDVWQVSGLLRSERASSRLNLRRHKGAECSYTQNRNCSKERHCFLHKVLKINKKT